MIKKFFFLSLLITCISNAEIPFIKKPWYETIQEWWDLFSRNTKKLTEEQENAIRKTEEDWDNNLKEFLYEAFFIIDGKVISEKKASELVSRELFKKLSKMNLKNYHHDSQLSPEYLLLLKQLCKEHNINPFFLNITVTALQSDEIIKFNFNTEKGYSMLIDQKKLSLLSFQEVLSLFDRKIKYFTTGFICHDSLMNNIINFLFDNFKKQLEKEQDINTQDAINKAASDFSNKIRPIFEKYAEIKNRAIEQIYKVYNEKV